jgi:tetratricopeptide (TPR) repeat protein
MDENLTAQQKFDRAEVLAGTGNWQTAVPLYLEAAQEFGAADDVASVARCYYNVARYARDVLQDYQSAEAAYLTALASFANASEQPRLAQIYISLMLNAEAAGWRAKAEGFGQLALAEAEAMNDGQDMFAIRNNLAYFHADGPEPATALRHAEAALRHAKALRQPKEIELAEYTLGYAQEKAGQYAAAEQTYWSSLRHSDDAQQLGDSAVCAHSLAKLVARDPARRSQALALFDDAVRRFTALGDKEATAEIAKERAALGS